MIPFNCRNNCTTANQTPNEWYSPAECCVNWKRPRPVATTATTATAATAAAAKWGNPIGREWKVCFVNVHHEAKIRTGRGV